MKLVAALCLFLLCGGGKSKPEKCVVLLTCSFLLLVLADEWDWDEMMASSVMPTVEPTSKPPAPPNEVKNQTFTLKDADNNSKVCLRISLGIAINITYINSTGVRSLRDSTHNHLLKCNFAAK